MATHKPRKRFGQNFLHDQGVIQRIVAALDPQPGQPLVEIGPGQGALTGPVLRACRRLHAVEIDRDLIARLQRDYADGLIIHQADALGFDFTGLAGDRRLRIFGNLPYNISTPLLFHLLDQLEVIEDLHFMLQKEVVQRMAAPPGSKQFGRLSVMVQYHCTVDYLFTVPPGAFFPAPAVDSAIVRLLPHPQKPHVASDAAQFEAVVKRAFGQRRKTIRNALKGLCKPDLIAAAGIAPTARAEQLSVADFVMLANQL